MNTKKNIIITGTLVVLSGIITAIMTGELSQVLRYAHALVLGSAGVFALVTGQESRAMHGRSKYYTGFGLIVITMTMSLGIFGTTPASFVNTLGVFLLLLGAVGFAFAQQLLTDREAGSAIAGIKFLVGILIAVGGAWILTIPGTHLTIAFLVSGGLFVLTGLAIIQLGRMTGIETKIEHPDI